MRARGPRPVETFDMSNPQEWTHESVARLENLRAWWHHACVIVQRSCSRVTESRVVCQGLYIHVVIRLKWKQLCQKAKCGMYSSHNHHIYSFLEYNFILHLEFKWHHTQTIRSIVTNIICTSKCALAIMFEYKLPYWWCAIKWGVSEQRIYH